MLKRIALFALIICTIVMFCACDGENSYDKSVTLEDGDYHISEIPHE